MGQRVFGHWVNNIGQATRLIREGRSRRLKANARSAEESSMDVNPPLPDVLEPDTLLLVPTATTFNLGVGENRETTLEEDRDFEILWTQLTDGRKALLAFTSEDELREWRSEGGYWIGLAVAEVARLAFESAFVDVLYVNAYNTEGKVFVIRPEDLPEITAW